MKRLFAFATIASLLFGAPGAILAQGTGSCQDQLIPLYTFPTAEGTEPPWTTVIGRTNGVYNSPLTLGRRRWIVLSVTLTGSPAFDVNWGAVIQNAHNTNLSPVGTLVLAYIDMNFGSVTETTVESEIATAVSLYFGQACGTQLYFDGIFFDRAPGTQGVYTGVTPSSYSQYLTDILNYAKGTQFGNARNYWLNTGFYPDEGVMNLVPGVTTGFILENDYADWSTIDIPDAPSWLSKYSSRRIANIVHDTSAAQMLTGTALAASIGANVVYFTDGTGVTPYTGLPSYWTQELAQVNGGC